MVFLSPPRGRSLRHRGQGRMRNHDSRWLHVARQHRHTPMPQVHAPYGEAERFGSADQSRRMKTPNRNQPATAGFGRSESAGSVVALYGIGFEWIEWTDKLQTHRPTPCHCSFCNLYQPVYAGLWCCRCRSQNNMRPLIEFTYRGDVLFARINPAYEGILTPSLETADTQTPKDNGTL